jgi:hypothetical protein
MNVSQPQPTQTCESRKEALRKIVADVLRELDGTTLDFYSDEQLEDLKHVIEEKVRQRMGDLCEYVTADIRWGEEPAWMHIYVHCLEDDDKLVAWVTIPVRATIATRSTNPCDVDIVD